MEMQGQNVTHQGKWLAPTFGLSCVNGLDSLSLCACVFIILLARTDLPISAFESLLSQ